MLLRLTSESSPNLVIGHVFGSRHHRTRGIVRPRETALGFSDQLFPISLADGTQTRNACFVFLFDLSGRFIFALPAFLMHLSGHVDGESVSRMMTVYAGAILCMFEVLEHHAFSFFKFRTFPGFGASNFNGKFFDFMLEIFTTFRSFALNKFHILVG